MSEDNILLAHLGDTRRRIVLLLRSQERTVRELADELGLTRNAVRAQLSKLKSNRLVEITDRRPTRRKPEDVYGLTRKAEQLFPKSYDSLFNAVLSVLIETEWVNAEQILQDVGARVAQAHKPSELESDPAVRVARARDVLEEIGGLPTVVEDDTSYRLEGASCPIAASVRVHGEAACDLARALIEELTELPVERQCDADGECPECKFVIGTK
jgi:predicted ArsR family transcriptional regulator